MFLEAEATIVGGNTLEMKPADHTTLRYLFNTHFEVIIQDRTQCTNNKNKSKAGGRLWCLDAFKTIDVKLSIWLGIALQENTHYEKSVHAGFKLSTDSQASFKASMKPTASSRLLWEFLEKLCGLFEHDKRALMWLPAHCAIKDKEKGDELENVYQLSEKDFALGNYLAEER